MDAHGRSAEIAVERPGTGTAARPPARRAFLTRSWLVAALVLVGLLFGARLALIELPAPVSLVESGNGYVIQSVAIGTELWEFRVRPGHPAELQDVEDRQLASMLITLPNGFATGQPLHQLRLSADHLLVAVLLAATGTFLHFARLPGSAVAFGASVGAALVPALPLVGLPAALPLAILPAAAAATAVSVPNRRSQRLFDVFALASLAVVLGAAVALMAGLDPVEWKGVWTAPLLVAIVVGGVGELASIQARWTLGPGDGSRIARMLRAVVPLAATSRLEGAEEERSRMAIELHNKVIPQVSSSAKAIRDDTGSDAAADRLDALAEELRGVVDRDETVTLQSAGVGAGLRAHLEGMSTFGLRVSFDIRDDRGRPPARVELAAYRIGQAAIDNALRHSGGELVEVIVNSAPDLLELVVRDDGVGIDDLAEQKARRKGRIGLAQMWLRAEAVGGSLDVRGHADKGTEVRFLWSA